MNLVNFGKVTIDCKDLELLEHNTIVFDFGRCLYKLMYLDRNDDKINQNNISENSTLLFTYRTFPYNNNEDVVLRDIKERRSTIILNNNCNKPILLCGNRGREFKTVIQRIFDVALKEVNDVAAGALGVSYLVDRDFISQHLYEEEVSTVEIDSRMFKIIKEIWKKRVNFQKDKKYPIMYVSLGSTMRIAIVHHDKRIQIVNHNSAGYMFSGLGKCILDTNDYTEITSLASSGYRGNVDTQVKDVLKDVDSSPYGKFPQDLPVMSFGKAMEIDSSENLNCSLSDLTNSLIAFLLEHINISALQFSIGYCCSSVYFGGNLFSYRQFRTEKANTKMRVPEVIPNYILKHCAETLIGMITWNISV